MKTQNRKATAGKAATAILIALLLVISQRVYSQPAEDWVSKVNGFGNNDKPKAMVLDNNGNVYITGSSEDSNLGKDVLTVKFSEEGKELWSARYSGETNSEGNNDEGNSIAVDNEGNVYVTGYTSGGFRGRDYLLIKYSPEGTQEWVRFYNGEGNIEDSDEEGVASAVDNSGNIIVTGYSDGTGTGLTFCTIKYDNKGDLLWKVLSQNINYRDSKAAAIKTDHEDNVIVSGYCTGVSSSRDFLTLKYSSDGKELWQQKYNGIPGNVLINDDEVSSMDIDSYGNIYVSGYSYGTESGKDFVTIKYTPEGNSEWISRYDNYTVEEERFDDEPVSVKADSYGNVFVTGKTTSRIGAGSDFLTLKIAGRGKTVWAKTYNSPQLSNTEDGAEDMALDLNGNVVVTGFSGPQFLSDCGRGKRFCTIKYSSDGDEKWVKEYLEPNTAEFSDDESKAVAIDKKGRIFVAGESSTSETQLDYLLIRYSEADARTKRTTQTAEVNAGFKLNNNFPNPFNPATKISFELPVSSAVRLGIYDMTGKEIALLVNSNLQKGRHEYEWNASQFASGTYFFKIQADGFVQTKKMLLVK